ncbi:MAG TPA: type II toxin-antitoxin system HicB family antitoxin [Longimicrobium sp.]|nr:type II toxin-antitoxin system HicB family antitoxin [Longimicrobium sp.]
MKYKGYTGSIEYDPDERQFYGRVEAITDIVSFKGVTVEALEADFRDGVDGYIAFCKEQGLEPQKPCSGRFVLRIPPELHREVALAARDARESLNTWITGAIKARLGEKPVVKRRPVPRRAA